jgi:hypothetical protein
VLIAELAAAFADAGTGVALDALLEPFAAHVVPVGGAGVLGPVTRARGFLALARGDGGAAVAHFEVAVGQCEALPSDPWTARTLADLATALGRAARPDDAAAALGRADTLAAAGGLRLPALTRRDT